MKNLLLAVTSAVLFLSCYSSDFTTNKRHGVKGLNEAMAENGAPKDFGSKGFVTWENGRVTDLNGNECFDFSSYEIVRLCNGETFSPNPELSDIWTNPENTPVYNFEGKLILSKAVSEKAVKQVADGSIESYDTRYELFNKILVVKEILLDEEELFGVYTVDGEEIVPLGTSWENTCSKLINYNGSEEIKKNINLILKFGTERDYDEKYRLEFNNGYIKEEQNGHFNVVDIVKGGYIAKNVEYRSDADSIMECDWFMNYHIFNKEKLSYQEFTQKLKDLQVHAEEWMKQKGYNDMDLMYNLYLCCSHENGQDNLVDLNGNVVLVADRINETRGSNKSNIIFVENSDGNNFFISYDENPMNETDIPGLQYRDYFDTEGFFLPAIPNDIKEKIQIPSIK